MEDKHFDKLYNKSFEEERQFSFDENQWGQLDSRLQENTKRRGFFWLPLGLIAAVGLISFITFYLINTNHKLEQQNELIQSLQTSLENELEKSQVDTVIKFITVVERDTIVRKVLSYTGQTTPSNIGPNFRESETSNAAATSFLATGQEEDCPVCPTDEAITIQTQLPTKNQIATTPFGIIGNIRQLQIDNQFETSSLTSVTLRAIQSRYNYSPSKRSIGFVLRGNAMTAPYASNLGSYGAGLNFQLPLSQKWQLIIQGDYDVMRYRSDSEHKEELTPEPPSSFHELAAFDHSMQSVGLSLAAQWKPFVGKRISPFLQAGLKGQFIFDDELDAMYLALPNAYVVDVNIATTRSNSFAPSIILGAGLSMKIADSYFLDSTFGFDYFLNGSQSFLNHSFLAIGGRYQF